LNWPNKSKINVGLEQWIAVIAAGALTVAVVPVDIMEEAAVEVAAVAAVDAVDGVEEDEAVTVHISFQEKHMNQ
jgi:hypothetical protein